MALEIAFADALEAAIRLIEQHPASGALRHADGIAGLPAPLRFHPVRGFERYLVYYVDMPAYVDVVRIWNCARGLDALMDEAD